MKTKNIMKTKLFTFFLATTLSCLGITATAETIITVAQANEICKSLSNRETTTESYEITGYMVGFNIEDYSPTYHNQTFCLADKDVYTFDTDTDAVAVVYRGSVDREVKRGYKVKIIAKIENYNGVTEFVNGTITILEEADIPFDNKCGQNVTWAFSEGILTINGVGSMYDYSTYELSPWYHLKNSINNIVISNTISHIGKWAFGYCSNMTSVVIPNGVTSVGYKAFFRCQSLTAVIIPNTVTSIGGDAFYNCTGLTSVHISDLAAWCNVSFTNGAANPLSKAHNLYLNGDLVTNLIIPNSVSRIGGNAFWGCTSLTSVTIGDNVTNIGDGAFSACSNLTSIEIPNSVTSIGYSAFGWCTGLTSVTCCATTLPELGDFVWEDVDCSKIPLYVPEESIELYKAADQWKEFNPILPISSSQEALDDIKTENGDTKILHNGQVLILRGEKTYTIQGQEVK